MLLLQRVSSLMHICYYCMLTYERIAYDSTGHRDDAWVLASVFQALARARDIRTLLRERRSPRRPQDESQDSPRSQQPAR